MKANSLSFGQHLARQLSDFFVLSLKWSPHYAYFMENCRILL